MNNLYNLNVEELQKLLKTTYGKENEIIKKVLVEKTLQSMIKENYTMKEYYNLDKFQDEICKDDKNLRMQQRMYFSIINKEKIIIKPYDTNNNDNYNNLKKNYSNQYRKNF